MMCKNITLQNMFTKYRFGKLNICKTLSKRVRSPARMSYQKIIFNYTYVFEDYYRFTLIFRKIAYIKL